MRMPKVNPALWASFLSLRDYHPYWADGAKNPASQAPDLEIMDFKNPKATNHDRAFGRILASLLEEADAFFPGLENIYLVPIPGHEANTTNTAHPLGKLVQGMVKARPDKFKDGCDLLIRIQTVQKRSGGGDRSIDLNSIQTKTIPKLKGSDMVLLDDVATSGNSIIAGRKLLEDGYAPNRVGALVIGRTTF